ncbi:MAG TPA: isoprenylcysteine carboxylmethyltransferase family protein [Thermoanaerobaculia bacterium]|nr:isoprenylcysteine carboxylmethyltransferase family protein [Thermoanaerobaculia bacterium]
MSTAHGLALAAVGLAWLLLLPIFLLLRRRFADGPSRRREPLSLLGMALQALGMGLAWGWRRPEGTPLVPGPESVQWALTVVVLLLLAGGLAMIAGALRALGRQWSLTARILEGHELVTEGPFRLVRHPIYTGLLAMLVAAGLASARPLGILVGVLVYWLGTRLRTHLEEGLLLEAFGDSYRRYAARVPALLPWPRPSGASAEKI